MAPNISSSSSKHSRLTFATHSKPTPPNSHRVSQKGKSNLAVLSKQVAPNPITERKKAAKPGRTLKAIFKGKHISSVGHFENCGRMLGAEDIAKYVIAHGGQYDRQVTRGTTHLICSIEEYKKKHPQVQAAWALGKKHCSIVVFDWLLDCTIGSKRCLRPHGYTLDRTLKRIQEGKTNHVLYRRKWEDQARESKELCDNRLYHVYYDQTSFEHKIILVRVNVGCNSTKPLLEKYTLYLFESHAFPHLYMFGAKLARTKRPTILYREECHAMEFSKAFKNFKRWFEKKTGVEWDFRLELKERQRMGGLAIDDGVGDGFGGLLGKEGEREREEREVGRLVKGEKVKPFVWTPPVLGRPVGLLPWGYVRPEERVVEGESADEEMSGGQAGKRSGGAGAGTGGQAGGDVVYDTDSDVDSDDDDEGKTKAEIERAGAQRREEYAKERLSFDKLVDEAFAGKHRKKAASQESEPGFFEMLGDVGDDE